MSSSPTSNSLALTESLSFAPEDFEVLDMALHINPELRAVAYGLKLARAAGVQYPIASLDDMVAYIPSDRIKVAGYVATNESIRVIFPKEFFPIEDEFDLLRKTFLVAVRRHAAQRAVAIDPAIYKHVISEA